MRDHKDRPLTALLIPQELEDLCARAKVELARRLVSKQEGIARGEGARDCDALLFAARELVREVLSPLAEPDLFEDSACRSPTLAPRDVERDSTFSRAVRPGNRLKLWKMKLTVLLRNSNNWPRETS